MKYFGTDGIRGEVFSTFKLDFLINIGTAISKIAKEKKVLKICIGYDPRISSNYITNALIATFLSNGIEVVNLGEVSTPVVSYTIINNEDIKIGIMISASHNPYTDNGIKIFGPDGKKLAEDLEKAIEDELENTADAMPFEKIGTLLNSKKYLTDYKEYIKSLGGDFTSLTVALDLSNGSASHIAPEIFESLGCKLKLIANEPNGYNINENVGSTKIETLVNYVKQNEVDFAFSYDGDADRVILVNRVGDVLDGDYIMYLLAMYKQNNNTLTNNSIVITSMANLSLKKALDGLGIKYIESSVGDKYVMRKLDEYNLDLGGEQSGHIILPSLLPTGDGILVSVILTKIILENNLNLVELVKKIPKYPQKLVNIEVENKDLIMTNQAFLKEIENKNKDLSDSGRILVRASGTENLIRIMVEHKNLEVCEELCETFLEKVKNIR